MGIYEQAYVINEMKKTVVEIFGLENNKTVDFFFKCDIMTIENLMDYFYTLTGVTA